MKKTILIVWWLCFILVNVGSIDAQECNGNFNLNKCNNGECIGSDLFCDGAIDCKDGSDETGEYCLKQICPAFAFRCTYGGCIIKTGKCDGKVDCADKSDENAMLCGYPTPNKTVESGIFQCNSGQRINLDDVCDGKRDCQDGSDETTETCTVVDCPDWGFRCSYGGCISKELTCNGVIDCVDGADEYRIICKNSSVIIPTTQTTIVVMPQNGCEIPNVPNVIVVLNTTGIEEIIAPGTYMEEFDSIQYKCKKQHLLEGSNTNLCLQGVWTFEQPQCIKYCSSTHLNGVTFSTTCHYKGIRISCNQPLRAGTIARVKCEVGYKKPDRVVQEVLLCDNYGEWDYNPFRCEPVCGTEQTEGVPFIIGGDTVNITVVPWHAAIYSTSRGFYEQICGGTIINAKVIVSAAHCVWDDKQQATVNYSSISVAVGKYFRDYFAEESLQAQYFNVSEIRVSDGYKGPLLAYQNDIAILVLNNFIIFRSYIKPICLEWFNYSQQGIKTGTVGRVAGWGRTGIDMKPSEELRMLEAPAVSYLDCLDKVDPRFRSDLASDKFCLQAIDGETSCAGDSGGGFVAPKILNGIKVYFLWGIVSNGLTARGSCAGDFYTAFTNIQYHRSMIDEYEANYRPK